MAHSSNIIKKIAIGSTTYEIHDEQAIHTLADLAALGLDVEGAFIFKGTVATVADLPSTGNKVGYVYHVTADHSEYVWVKVDDATTGSWEEFGEHFVVDHIHSIPALSGTCTVTGTNGTSAVSGSATVTGTNAASTVSGSCSVTVPKVSKTANYIKMSTGNDTFVKSYPGATSKMVTTSITPAGTAVSVINSVTPTTGSVTGVSGSTTASKATAGTAVAVAKVGSAVTVATGLNSGSTGTGTAHAASVDANGTLTLTPVSLISSVTFPTAKTTSITPAASGGNITPYTFTDVTVPKAASAATTVVTGVTTGSTNAATVGSAVTVATGSLASNGGGASVMTGLGTATTAKALTSASLDEATSADGVLVGDTVGISTESKTGTISGTAAAQVWTQASGTISGTAAAQKWTQASGTVATTASNTGNAKAQ